MRQSLAEVAGGILCVGTFYKKAYIVAEVRNLLGNKEKCSSEHQKQDLPLFSIIAIMSSPAIARRAASGARTIFSNKAQRDRLASF